MDLGWVVKSPTKSIERLMLHALLNPLLHTQASHPVCGTDVNSSNSMTCRSWVQALEWTVRPPGSKDLDYLFYCAWHRISLERMYRPGHVLVGHYANKKKEEEEAPYSNHTYRHIYTHTHTCMSCPMSGGHRCIGGVRGNTCMGKYRNLPASRDQIETTSSGSS